MIKDLQFNKGLTIKAYEYLQDKGILFEASREYRTSLYQLDTSDLDNTLKLVADSSKAKGHKLAMIKVCDFQVSDVNSHRVAWWVHDPEGIDEIAI